MIIDIVSFQDIKDLGVLEWMKARFEFLSGGELTLHCNLNHDHKYPTDNTIVVPEAMTVSNTPAVATTYSNYPMRTMNSPTSLASERVSSQVILSTPSSQVILSTPLSAQEILSTPVPSIVPPVSSLQASQGAVHETSSADGSTVVATHVPVITPPVSEDETARNERGAMLTRMFSYLQSHHNDSAMNMGSSFTADQLNVLGKIFDLLNHSSGATTQAVELAARHFSSVSVNVLT